MQHILIAGIGNIFLGDDGFGVEVVRRLLTRPLPEGVRVVDFGIRGMDLVYSLLDDYAAVIFVDIAPRGEAPGTLSLIEVQPSAGGDASIDTHGMDPVKVLNLARELGAPPRPTYVVACEPAEVLEGQADGEMFVGLSQPVQLVIEDAVRMVESLIEQVLGICVQ